MQARLPMPRQTFVSMAIAATLAAGSPTTSACGAAAGRMRAQQACAVCHRPLGIAAASDAPNLAAWYASIRIEAHAPN